MSSSEKHLIGIVASMLSIPAILLIHGLEPKSVEIATSVLSGAGVYAILEILLTFAYAIVVWKREA